MKFKSLLATIFLSFLIFSFFSCATTKAAEKQEFTETEISEISTNPQAKENTEIPSEDSSENKAKKLVPQTTSINLLFGGDIMAHNENYRIDDFHKIWTNVEDVIQGADLAFANLESPVDTTKKEASYPYFNMKKSYLEAAIDAGFDVFSLCNNHSSDQGLNGIKETEKTLQEVSIEYENKNQKIYYSGLKKEKSDSYTYNVINKNGWTILFLPITELLNLYENKDYINYSKDSAESRAALLKFCTELREKNPCDLFILSLHTSEPEYVRSYTKAQTKFYEQLLNSGVDVIWANHAHIIKDRKIIINTKDNSNKIIMYGNGNTISGQRRAPVLTQKNPNGERDNTGDGILYKITFTKTTPESKPAITYAKPIYITTYINTAGHFILRKLDDDFVNYLYNVPRKDWADYINRRIAINEEYTKDIIEWQ